MDTKPLISLDAQASLIRRLENVLCHLLYFLTEIMKDRLRANLLVLVKPSPKDFEYPKAFCLCQGGNGGLDTFPVCLLPVSQNSKCLHNGRKLEPASCARRVLWKQIGKCLSRPAVLTEPG